MLSVELKRVGQVHFEELADAGDFLSGDMSIHDADNFLLN